MGSEMCIRDSNDDVGRYANRDIDPNIRFGRHRYVHTIGIYPNYDIGCVNCHGNHQCISRDHDDDSAGSDRCTDRYCDEQPCFDQYR